MLDRFRVKALSHTSNLAQPATALLPADFSKFILPKFAQVQLGQKKFEKVGRQKCVCANFRAINVYNPVILHYL